MYCTSVYCPGNSCEALIVASVKDLSFGRIEFAVLERCCAASCIIVVLDNNTLADDVVPAHYT